MFDFGYGELLVIGIAALIFIGPKELPGVLRALGQWMAKIRRMAGEFQNQFQEAMREAELADLKKEVDDMASQAASYSHFDPLAEVRKEMASAQHDIETSLAEKPASAPTSGAAATPPATGDTAVAGRVQPDSSQLPDAAQATPPGVAAEPVQTSIQESAQAPAKESVPAQPTNEPVKPGSGGGEPA
jgi:sec-independent protein translocase protein TatB